MSSGRPDPTVVLDAEAVRGLASLVAVGRQSGDTVLGLSGVRRSRDLAWVFLEEGISLHTRRELEGLVRRGVRVMVVHSIEPMTAAFGRRDVRIVGVRRGNLARGVAERLAALQGPCP